MRFSIWFNILIVFFGEYSFAIGSIRTWFDHLNSEMQIVNQLTAYFAWELSVSANNALLNESIEFNAIKSQWLDKKCRELDNYMGPHFNSNPTKVNLNKTMPEKVWSILCSGPKFSEQESMELTKILYEMQETFTETKICLPKHFDICLNIDWIYDFTYKQDKNGNLRKLNMSDVMPKSTPLRKTQLKFYDGNVTEDYFVAGAIFNTLDDVESDLLAYKIHSSPMICFDGEPDLDKIVKGHFDKLQRSDCALKFNLVFRWAWESWRIAVGNQIGRMYPIAVNIMNIGARSKGFSDIGAIWRHEIELPDLENMVRKLNNQIKPLYQLLHGVLRDALWKRVHTFEKFNKHGTMPAHMLGSMWAQSWEIYQQLMMPYPEVNLDQNLMDMKWSGVDMVKRADDFYSSLGLPPMPSEFWTKSNFQKNGNFGKCHGTAANMFNGNDYRMIVCAESTWEDFYVIVHEMGHLQYYMAYNRQPVIYQDANSAMQESIGDAIYMGFMTPQNLNRLRLLPDEFLFTNSDTHAVNEIQSEPFENCKPVKSMPHVTVVGKPYPNVACKNKNESNPSKMSHATFNDFDLSLLLKMALTKIPQIPFEYIVDVFRWNIFSGNVTMQNANEHFWNLAFNEQGIHPPDWENRHGYFDAGAKYHVADNTPFVRYFLASFIQAQIFRGLCEITVFGYVNPGQPLPMPLHRCDIYGSKRAGKLLKKALSVGAEKHWTEVLYILTGSREVSADALLLYYEPLIAWMEREVIAKNIKIGW